MEITLTAPQTSVFADPATYKVLVCGRRFGKTFLALVWLISRALQSDDDSLHYFVAPNRLQAKRIAWRELKKMCAGFMPRSCYKTNESDLSITIRATGVVIQLLGAENEDSLRGVSLTSLVLDEFALMSETAWTEALSPTLANTDGKVLFLTSPRGWNWAKTLYDNAQNDDWDDWSSWSYTTADGGNVSPAFLAAERKRLPARVYKQEYLASFESLANRVYSNFDRFEHVTSTTADISNQNDLHIGIDFNVSMMSACVCIKTADQLHVVDEILIENSNTTELAETIRRKYPDHNITVYPDPSGKARKTSSAGITDFIILEEKKYNFKLVAPNKAPAVVDRINEVQAMLINADGDTRMYIHPRCQNVINTLDGLTYKGEAPDKDGDLDHMHDALGYVVNSLFPLKKSVVGWSVGGLAA